MNLDDRVVAIQRQLSSIEAYRKIAEWLNATVPADKALNKFITNSDTLVEVALELSQFAKMKAESLAGGVDISIHAFDKDEVLILKQLIGTLRSKMPHS